MVAPSPFTRIHDNTVRFLAPHAKKPVNRFLGQEVFGSGVPHVALGMNFGDRVDQFYQQFAQEVGSYVATYQFSKLVEKLYDADIQRMKPEDREKALAWKSMGVALASLPVLAATDYSAMYLRNYLTSKTFKTHDFVELVGLSHNKQNPQQPESDSHKKERHQFEKQQLLIIAKALGISLGLGALGVAWTRSQMKKGASLPQFITKEFKIPFTDKLNKGKGIESSLFKLLSFKDGKMDNITDLQVFSTFGSFGYAGLIFSARDMVERFECIVKFAWYGFANMIIPNAVNKKLEPWLEKKAQGNADRKSVYSFLATVATGAFLYALPPTLACLFTRKDRAEALQAQNKSKITA
jgi:hypothetical protein